MPPTARLDAGYAAASCCAMPAISAFACAAVTPGLRRPTTDRYRALRVSETTPVWRLSAATNSSGSHASTSVDRLKPLGPSIAL